MEQAVLSRLREMRQARGQDVVRAPAEGYRVTGIEIDAPDVATETHARPSTSRARKKSPSPGRKRKRRKP